MSANSRHYGGVHTGLKPWKITDVDDVATHLRHHEPKIIGVSTLKLPVDTSAKRRRFFDDSDTALCEIRALREHTETYLIDIQTSMARLDAMRWSVSLLLWFAVYCSVLQCVAVCSSVLLCVALCCTVLHCVAVCCSVLQCVDSWCSVMLCAAVCCSVLLRGAVWCSVVQCGAVWCGVLACAGP